MSTRQIEKEFVIGDKVKITGCPDPGSCTICPVVLRADGYAEGPALPAHGWLGHPDDVFSVFRTPTPSLRHRGFVVVALECNGDIFCLDGITIQHA